MLAAASVPATIINWAGDEVVNVETYCSYMGEIAGIAPKFEHIPSGIKHTSTDNTRRRDLVGDCQVKWQDGMRRMMVARHPELGLTV